MTLGRVYVPPNRQTTNQFLVNRMTNYNDNSVIQNGHCEPKQVTNGYKTIQIKVAKKEESAAKKIDPKVHIQEEHSTTKTKPEVNGIINHNNNNNNNNNNNYTNNCHGTTNGLVSKENGVENSAGDDDLEWEPEDEPTLSIEDTNNQSGSLPVNEPQTISIPIKISVSTSNWNGSSSEKETELAEPETDEPEAASAEQEEEEEQVVPSRWKEFEEEQANGEVAEEEDESDYGKTNGEVSCLNGSLFAGLPNNAKGLKNLGNTCFMNSIIQCMASTETLLEFCQNYDSGNAVSTFIGKVAASAKEPKITRAFVKLVQEMWKTANSTGSGSNHGVADPSGFRREMTFYAPKFGGYDQHDSQEFLQYVLEGLHSEMNRSELPVKKKPEMKKVEQSKNKENEDLQNGNAIAESSDLKNGNTEEVAENKDLLSSLDDLEAPGISAEEKGRRAWRQYLKRDNSFITDLFLGLFRSTLKCSVCEHESVTFEPFWVVSVPINIKTSKDITDCLQLFVAEETLDGDEKPTCESCKMKQKCTKWYSFERWPKILVIHLKRFAPTGSYRAKLSSQIDTPLKNLDLSSFSSNKLNQTRVKQNGLPSSQTNVIYDCYGISNHSGTLSGGHYTAYCRHPHKTQNWHLYNDRCVSGTNPDHVVTGEAYLLFFERKDIPTD